MNTKYYLTGTMEMKLNGIRKNSSTKIQEPFVTHRQCQISYYGFILQFNGLLSKL